MHLTDIEDIELDLFIEAMRRRHGYDFANYAHASFKRRVLAAVQTAAQPDISSLTRILLHGGLDPQDLIAQLFGAGVRSVS